jgi:hypothetical protein
MADVHTGVIATVLSTLRTLPLWLFAGLAVVGFSILYLPSFGGINPSGFRASWGVWVWIGTLTCSILALARGIDLAIKGFHISRTTNLDRRALRLVPLDRQRWWHLVKQQDDTFTSQISFKFEAANLTDNPIRIVKARLIRPKVKSSALIQSSVSLPAEGSPYHSDKHSISPRSSVTADLHMMVRGPLASRGKPLYLTLGITDQFGKEYRIRRIEIPTSDPIQPKTPWKATLGGLRKLAFRRRAEKLDALPVHPSEWDHAGKYDAVDLILIEERRNYAARGRAHGKLGSLNVGLQSEPNYGSTTVGTVPQLLWDRANATPLASPNAVRLITLRDQLHEVEKADLERYLVSHLDKHSPYADIAYFIFLVLHRVGRTVEALQGARARLKGDKHFGYSNLLATLSALVSHEHFEIESTTYARITEALAGDSEYNFRLTEKINLARLQQLDSRMGVDPR